MAYDVIGIGNPLLDETVNVSDEFLKKYEFVKGSMVLVDDVKAKVVLEALSHLPSIKGPGGSVANALSAVVALGGKALFLGKIGSGADGDTYERLTQECGITSGLTRSGKMQGTCAVLITPDTERTMITYLGAALHFTSADIDFEAIKEAKVLHVEAYQLDGEAQTKAAFKAMEIAKEFGVKISIDLADSFLIQRHRETLTRLITDYADIVFANETEAKEFTGLEEEKAAQALADMCEVAIVKIGEMGSIIATAKDMIRIPAEKITAVNTNGAGDAYAGAFLASFTQGKTLEECGKLAAHVGAQVVAHEESRIHKDWL